MSALMPPTSNDAQPYGDALMLTAAEHLRRMREERDRMREALRDLRLGAQIMLQPPIDPKSAIANYAREVERVAGAAIEGSP